VGGPSSPVPTRRILGIQVDATSYQHATVEILRCGSLGESRYVCVATVNNVIEACDDPAYREHAAALGLGWLFRLLHEPRRLWRRYLCRNPRSIALFVLQLTGRGRAAVPARLCMS
jgi:UDP-N-acetyl-D-mannosaminuronic acid transferase (WecB/TagA/CpsF family)